jgi:hypothetical protein
MAEAILRVFRGGPEGESRWTTASRLRLNGSADALH